MKLANKSCAVETYYVKDDGVFPNSYLPVLLYKNALNLPLFFASRKISALFEKHGWSNSWKSGVLTFHHYHSVTHEVLGFCKGETTLQVGGEKGKTIQVRKGDVLLIPAGMAHKNLGKENAVTCIGAYPGGKDYDMNYGKANERPRTDKAIYTVSLPEQDPVFGKNGKMQEYWKL